MCLCLSGMAQTLDLDENGFVKLKWPTYSKELEKQSKVDDDALVDLAICYGFGLGVKQDKKKCDKIFREYFNLDTEYTSSMASLHPYASLWWGIFIWSNSNYDYTIKKLKWDKEHYGTNHNDWPNYFKSVGINYIGYAAEGGHELAQLIYARSNRGSIKYSCPAIRKWNIEMVPMGWSTGYYTNAMEWYTKACEHGNPYIIYEYADYLDYMIANKYDERHVADIYNLAYYCYKQAAEKGHPAAARCLGNIEKNGYYYRAKRQDAALEWYRKAIALGDAESYALASDLLLEKDVAEAITLLNEGVEMDDGNSASLLGKCYRIGRGVATDYDKAFTLFNKGVELGSLSATYELGCCYEYGWGCDKSDSKAFECYKLCVDADEWCDEKKQAAKKLANMYDTGRGIFMNKEKAEYYSKLYN